MSDDYLWDRSGSKDPDVAKLEELLAPLAHDAPLDELRLRRPRRRVWWIVGGAALAAVAALVLYLALPRHPVSTCTGGAGYAFTGRGGAVTCGGGELAAGVLPVGGSLDTGAHEADLAIATIGNAELGPHTRVRLEESGAKQRLALDVGRMHAKVDAPPRLFEVATKHANVVDLGCEYTITVDANGVGSIVIQRGRVELATGGGMFVVAPIGTHVAILAGQRPGLPLTGANTALARAVGEYEHGAPGALDRVLAAAETPDAITLIALAAIDVAHRPRILARLAEVQPPPSDVTVEAATAGGAPFDAWRDDIVETYLRLWRP
jgi:ferric-dicitrate binding protein FerR (iron transport regulator)